MYLLHRSNQKPKTYTRQAKHSRVINAWSPTDFVGPIYRRRSLQYRQRNPYSPIMSTATLRVYTFITFRVNDDPRRESSLESQVGERARRQNRPGPPVTRVRREGYTRIIASLLSATLHTKPRRARAPVRIRSGSRWQATGDVRWAILK